MWVWGYYVRINITREYRGGYAVVRLFAFSVRIRDRLGSSRIFNIIFLADRGGCGFALFLRNIPQPKKISKRDILTSESRRFSFGAKASANFVSFLQTLAGSSCMIAKERITKSSSKLLFSSFRG